MNQKPGIFQSWWPIVVFMLVLLLLLLAPWTVKAQEPAALPGVDTSGRIAFVCGRDSSVFIVGRYQPTADNFDLKFYDTLVTLSRIQHIIDSAVAARVAEVGHWEQRIDIYRQLDTTGRVLEMRDVPCTTFVWTKGGAGR